MFRRFGLLALVALLAAPLAVPQGTTDYDQEIEASKRKLEQLRQEAETMRRRARDYAKREQDVFGQLEQTEEALKASRRYLRGLEEREALLGDEIRRTDKRLGATHERLETQRDALRRRLRYGYTHGRARSLEILLSAESFPELLERTAFLSRFVRQDRELVISIRKDEASVRQDLDRLRRKREEIDQLQIDKEAERASFEELRSRQSTELTKVRTERSRNEQAAAELERSAEQMKSILAELERKRKEALARKNPLLAELDRNDFGANRGRLPWPVQGKVVGNFGRHVHPKYNTVTMNNGIDIAAPHGAPVGAVGDGVVELVRWLDGYGQSVILNHGKGFYSVYAHLSAVRVAVGDRVVPGQAVGNVGDTGSLKGTVLHFEIRQGSAAEDPLRWLRR
jgi:septal ring factor EnvC (AmiA/AmiB activator)